MHDHADSRAVQQQARTGGPATAVSLCVLLMQLRRAEYISNTRVDINDLAVCLQVSLLCLVC
jgi:hypothetical protein